MQVGLCYTAEHRTRDKRVYGALDGDFARKCPACGARFCGTDTRKCSRCENGERKLPMVKLLV